MELRILIADDHAVIRDGLKSILETESDLKVVGLAPNGTEAVDLAEQLQPDVILMDIRMPGMDGIEATRRVMERCPQTAVIMLTMYDRDEYLFEAVKMGAKGYILKDVPSAEVVNAVRAGGRGESLLHPAIARKLMEGFAAITGRPQTPSNLQQAPAALSAREMEVLRLLGAGLSNRQIGCKLFISERTVKKHIGQILEKLQVRSRTEAVIMAVQRRLITLPEETIESAKNA